MSTSFSAANPDPAHPPLRLFGLPLGGFGLFGNLLLSFTLGVISFLIATFLSLFVLLVYNAVGRHAIDFNVSYKFIALPIGLIVLAVSAVVLTAAWLRERLAAHP
jgi:hypothetical protein